MTEKQQQISLDMALARAAHDMRNPLQVISGHAEVLTLQSKDASVHHAAKRILQQSDYLLQVMDDLVDFVRPSDNTIERMTFDKMLSTLYAQVELKAQAEMVQLYFPDSVPIILSNLTLHRISRVLLNLINNAIYPSAGGSIRLDIHTKGPYLILVVTDSGTGIDFDPSSTGLETVIVQKGLGLGIVATLVKDLNGSVRWHSQPHSHVEVRLSI